ncbi:ankyrin repeat-containing domain protein [Whalleya microplaca]|nr:ankyrin repeat-containing domain protein [Whalleya microplaca]
MKRDTRDEEEGQSTDDDGQLGHENCCLSSTLVEAVRFGNTASIRFLAPHADLQYKEEYGWTALHYAAWENRAEAVELLLDNGSRIECEDRQDATPLLLACLGGYLRVVQVLLDRGANPDHIAVKSARYRALHIAARDANEPLVRILLEAGASENARLDQSMGGDTPLHLAVSSSQKGSQYVRAARTLLEFGAEVNALNENGNTPLLMAINLKEQNEDMVKTLLEFGADPDKLDSNGHSPLYHSISKNSPVAEYLWDPQGALQQQGVSVLFNALSMANLTRVQQLLEAGCDKNEKDKWDRTAFDVATDPKLRSLLALKPESRSEHIDDEVPPESLAREIQDLPSTMQYSPVGVTEAAVAELEEPNVSGTFISQER